MIFLAVVVILGLVKRQPRRYWLHAAGAIALHFSAHFLFAGGGTLEDPGGDGVITAMVRRATQDGPGVLAMMPFALGLGWVVPIWLVVRGYERRPRSVPDQSPQDTTTDAHAPAEASRIRAQRHTDNISEGFRRLSIAAGVVGAAAWVLLAAMLLVSANGYGGIMRRDWIALVVTGALFPIVPWAIVRGIGWIVAGFRASDRR